MKLTDYIVSFFEKQGVQDVFMLSGGGCMHLINSFGSSRKMRYWCLHHEQAVAMATEAYGRFTQKLGVCVVTCGPGATNTITGLLGAYQDSSPCVFISGQAKRAQTVHNCGINGLRQFGQQEVDIIPIVSSITKYAVMINKPEEIRYHLEKAVYLARNGRPGPVWIDVPLDVQNSEIDENNLKGFVPVPQAMRATDAEIRMMADLIQVSRRPVIVAGQGVRIAGACEELKQLVEQYDIPVVNSFLGIDVLDGESKCNIGRIGVKGSRAGNFTLQNADLVIAIGSRLSVSSIGFQPEYFAREAKVVVVDIDEAEHKKNMVRIDQLVLADAKDVIVSLATYLKKNSSSMRPFSRWLETANRWKDKFSVFLPQYEDDSQGINYYKFIDLLNANLCKEMPVVADAGSAFYVTSQAIHLKEDERYVPSGALATMGYTLPAAIGIAVANEGRPVIGITGDGSLQQNIQELVVMRAHHLPVKLFVMNNEGYLSIRTSQRKFFKDNFVAEGPKSGVFFPETSAIAEAYGLNYYKLDTIEKAKALLPKILEDSEPVVIEVMTLPFQEIIPSTASTVRQDGSMVSKPMEDMYPFMDRETFQQEMIVRPVNE